MRTFFTKKRVFISTSLLIVTAIFVWWTGLLRLDLPIPGGIMAYRSHDPGGRFNTSCACGHEGYFIIQDRLLLWYVTDHESVQSTGFIMSQEGDEYFLRAVSGTDYDLDVTYMEMEMRENYLHIDSDAEVDDPDYEFSLKRTYLGPEVRILVEGFMAEKGQAILKEDLNWVSPRRELAPILFVYHGDHQGVAGDLDEGNHQKIIKAFKQAEIEFFFKTIPNTNLTECHLGSIEDRQRALEICKSIDADPSWTKYCSWNYRREKLWF